MTLHLSMSEKVNHSIHHNPILSGFRPWGSIHPTANIVRATFVAAPRIPLKKKKEPLVLFKHCTLPLIMPFCSCCRRPACLTQKDWSRLMLMHLYCIMRVHIF